MCVRVTSAPHITNLSMVASSHRRKRFVHGEEQKESKENEKDSNRFRDFDTNVREKVTSSKTNFGMKTRIFFSPSYEKRGSKTCSNLYRPFRSPLISFVLIFEARINERKHASAKTHVAIIVELVTLTHNPDNECTGRKCAVS